MSEKRMWRLFSPPLSPHTPFFYMIRRFTRLLSPATTALRDLSSTHSSFLFRAFMATATAPAPAATANGGAGADAARQVRKGRGLKSRGACSVCRARSGLVKITMRAPSVSNRESADRTPVRARPKTVWLLRRSTLRLGFRSPTLFPSPRLPLSPSSPSTRSCATSWRRTSCWATSPSLRRPTSRR